MLSDYVHHVVKDEWALQSHGSLANDCEKDLEELIATTINMDPKTERQKAVYAIILTQLNALSKGELPVYTR